MDSTTTRCKTRHRKTCALGHIFESVAISVKEQLISNIKFGSKKVIILAGPTGSGKTAISLELAQKLGAIAWRTGMRLRKTNTDKSSASDDDAALQIAQQWLDQFAAAVASTVAKRISR